MLRHRTLSLLTALLFTLISALTLLGCDSGTRAGKRSVAGTAPASANQDDQDDDDEQSRPDARIVVIVDESASFEKDLPTAARIISRFVRENAVGGSCEVYLIGIDRNPRMLGFYPAEELMDQDGSKILQKISAVTPLDGTDIVGGLRLAAMKLKKDNGSKPGRRMLLAFTDGYVDPAKQQLSETRTFPPLDAFSWNQLTGVDTHFYFVNTANEALLTNLLQQHGVTGQVFDPTESRKTVLTQTVEQAVGDDD